ncbi:hypothetical protein M9X92_011846 [Pyricularia oryzae]|nr:hypothetical protein M9X92_011846 [Pyricularia oryzae]
MCEQDNDNHLKLRCRDQHRTYDRPLAPARLTSIAAGALSCSADHTFSPSSAFPGQSPGGLGVMGQFLAILGKEDSYAPRSFCVALESRWLTVGYPSRATAKGRAPPPGLELGPLILESVLPVLAAHEYLRKSTKRLSAMAATAVRPLSEH